MHKAVLIGSKSKIGQSILHHWTNLLTLIPPEELETEKVDFLFLCTTKDKAKAYVKKYPKSPNLVILDFSGATRPSLGINPHITYGFEPLFDKNKSVISFLGCSSLGILHALYPLKHLLQDTVFIDTKFPRSAIKHNSPNLANLSGNCINLLTGSHPHQAEVRKILNFNNLVMSPSLIDIPQGISLSIFIPNLSSTLTKATLQSFYEHNREIILSPDPVDVRKVINTSKCHIHITGDDSSTIMTVAIDNLVNNRYLHFLNFNNPYFII